MKLLEKGKKFVKDHKKIVIGGALVTTGVVSCVILKKTSVIGRHPLRDIATLIDEEIFTELAPEIEQAVLDKGVDSLRIEKYFDLGEDNLFKHVEVKITQYAGD